MEVLPKCMKAEGQERINELIRDGTEKQDGQHGKETETDAKQHREDCC